MIIAIIGLYKPIIAQSVVFNQNYNYSGNVFISPNTLNPINANKYYNNESFRTLYENNLSIIGLGWSTNNRALFPNLINNDSTFLFASKVDVDLSSIEISDNIFYVEAYSGGININQNKSVLVGTINNSLSQIQDSTKGVIFVKNFDLVSTEEIIDLGRNTGIRGVEKNINLDYNYVYGFVLREDTFDYNLYILKYDNDLILVDSSIFYLHYFNGISHLSFSDENDIFISGLQWENGIIVQGAFLAKLNSNLEVIWSKKYDRGANRIFIPRKSTHTFQSENFYLIGNTILSGGGPWPIVQGGLLIKTDAEGNELWQKTYNRGNPDYSEFFSGIKAHPDGTLIIAGETRDYSYTPTPSAPRGWLIKMDTEGNIIWERTLSRYHEYDWDDYVNDVLLTSDGGIALAGYVIHNDIQDALGIYHRNDAWLVKTDSCGFTTGDEPEPLILVQSNQELTIQLQNATQNYCTATLTWGDGTEEQIYAYSQPIYGYSPNLTHTYTQPGTYQVCIEALAGEEFRSYCTEVIIEPNSINSLPQGGGLGEGVKIFPNPTKNYFILEMTPPPNPLPIGAGGAQNLPHYQGGNEGGKNNLEGSIFTISGQLVHQFPIANQLQQKIDISNLAEGVYYIKINTSPLYKGGTRGVNYPTQKLVVVR